MLSVDDNLKAVDERVDITDEIREASVASLQDELESCVEVFVSSPKVMCHFLIESLARADAY